MKNYLIKNFKDILLTIIAWTIGFYILRKSANLINLEEPEEIHIYHILFLFISFLFILLPFIKTIKIGKLLELQRDIGRTKEEVKDFKTEVKQSMTLLSTSINTSINSLNSNINISIPGTDDLRKEIEKLRTEVSDARTTTIKNVKEEILSSEEGDHVMALAKTRIEIEKTLREKLNKRLSVGQKQNIEDIKFLTLNRLGQLYIKENPEFEKFWKSFKYVQSICNAAIHGQNVSYEQAYEALQLGTMILTELKEE
jgi:hypothetical protein